MSHFDELARCIMALIQPLTGDRATGKITISATSADVVMTHKRWLAPVINGQLREDMAVKVAFNPDEARGKWTVTNAGIEVPAFSLVGGARHNLMIAGTVMRWLGSGGSVAVDDGISPDVLVTDSFVGGTTPTAFGAIKSVGTYEQFRAPFKNTDLLRAGLAELPAVMIVWGDSEPAEGSAGDKITQAGYGVNLFREKFQIIVVVNRRDSDPTRRGEGLQLLSDISDLIAWRQDVDRVVFSTPEALQILTRSRVMADETMYAYQITFRLTYAQHKTDKRTFSDWLKTRMDVDKRVTTDEDSRGSIRVVTDDEFEMQ